MVDLVSLCMLEAILDVKRSSQRLMQHSCEHMALPARSPAHLVGKVEDEGRILIHIGRERRVLKAELAWTFAAFGLSSAYLTRLGACSPGTIRLSLAQAHDGTCNDCHCKAGSSHGMPSSSASHCDGLEEP